MLPRISIVIPVYNQSHKLEQALHSIETQTYRPLEVIIVDDGSISPVDIRQSIADPNVSLHMIRQKNTGAPAARNRGLQEATGKYVIFWDADVVGNSNMLQMMYDALCTHPEKSYAYSDFYFGRKKMRSRSFDDVALLNTNYIHTTALIRRNHLLEYSRMPWDETLGRFQDWDLWLSLLKQRKRGVYIPETLFRVAPGGTMSRWLPQCVYRRPWKFLPGIRGRVRAYDRAKEIIVKKHGL